MAVITRNHRIATPNLAPPIVNIVPAKILRAASEPGVASTPVTLVQAGDALGQPQVEPTEDEERAQRDDEARAART